MLKFFHNPQTGICIAYEPNSDLLPRKNARVFNMTTVLCNPKDTYNKKIARQLAQVNFLNGRFITVKLPKDQRPTIYFGGLSESLHDPYGYPCS